MSREIIQKSIDQVLAQHPAGLDFNQFKAALAERGIEAQASITKNGRLQGFSYKFDSIAWPASKLGSDYSLGLLTRGLRIDAAAMARRDAADEADHAEEAALDNALDKKQMDDDDAARAAIIQDARARKREDDDIEAEVAQRQPGGLAAAINHAPNRRVGTPPFKLGTTPAAQAMAAQAPALAHVLLELTAEAIKFGIEAARRLMHWISQLLRRIFGLPPGEPLVEIDPPPRLAYQTPAPEPLPQLPPPAIQQAQALVANTRARLASGASIDSIISSPSAPPGEPEPITIKDAAQRVLDCIHLVNTQRSTQPAPEWQARVAAAKKVGDAWAALRARLSKEALALAPLGLDTPGAMRSEVEKIESAITRWSSPPERPGTIGAPSLNFVSPDVFIAALRAAHEKLEVARRVQAERDRQADQGDERDHTQAAPRG